MSTGATPEDTGNAGGAAHPEGISGGTSEGTRPDGGPARASVPVAPDRPVVDGASMSVDELEAEIAAEVEELGDERHQEVDQLRTEVADTAAELSTRFDVAARARAAKDETLARVGWWGPAALAAAAVLVVLLARRRRRVR
jgi:hypothetical protein